jgi:hypothetical protein
MTSSINIARLGSTDCQSNSASSFKRKRGSGRAGGELPSVGRSSGRKSGAVWQISFLKISRGPRRVCMRPSSSGAPATMRSIERTKAPISCIISTTGSEVGALGRREMSSFTSSSSLSTSPCSSGSLTNSFNQPQRFDVLKLTASKSSQRELGLGVA